MIFFSNLSYIVLQVLYDEYIACYCRSKVINTYLLTCCRTKHRVNSVTVTRPFKLTNKSLKYRPMRRRHLVNAYEVKAGIGLIAGNTV